MTSKRAFDIICSVMLLVASAPILALIALLVRLTSEGDVIFKQQRAGYRGAVFTIFKFRTMRERSGKALEVILTGDDRVTPIGKFLRSTHLDELPQLWNVIRGEMSLVGPRPISLEWFAKREEDILNYRDRLKVLPGITGLVQIRGRSEALSRGDLKNFLLDLSYIQHQNFFLDIEILLRTLSAVVKRQGI